MAGPVVVVSGRHRPHEILLLAVSLVTGVAYTVGSPAPSSVAALLPGWALHVWAAGLAVSGALGLVGALSRPAWRALRLEQAAMLIGGASMTWYAAAIVPFGARAAFSGAVCLAWVGANLWRALQIRHDLRESSR